MKKISTKGDSQTQQPVFMMPSFFIMHFFLVKFCIQSPKHVTVIYYKTMFNNVFNKEKGFWADLGEVQRLSNVFSNERMAVD